MPTPVIKPSLKTWLFNHNSDYCTLRTPTPVVETFEKIRYARHAECAHAHSRNGPLGKSLIYKGNRIGPNMLS